MSESDRVGDWGFDPDPDDEPLTIDFDSDDVPFNRCDDCGQVHVSKKAHTCSANRTREIPVGDSSASRRRRAEADQRDPDGIVLISKFRRQARAYHRAADPDGEPRRPKSCKAHPKVGTKWSHVTRREAKARGMFPCAFCFGVDEAGTREVADE